MPQITFNGITWNLVTVTGTFLTLSGGAVVPCAGTIQFNASDLAWDATVLSIGYLPQVSSAISETGTISVQLFAMDNPNVSTDWAWIVTGEIDGFPLPRRQLTVNYSNGDSQDLSVLLSTSTLVT